MTIDKAISGIEKRILPTYDNDADHKALVMAIDTMRKYQRIQAIINNAKDSDGAVKYNWLYEQIKEVVEDDNT